MIKRRWHIVFFTGTKGDKGVTGNVAYGTEGMFWRCLFPVHEEVIEIITESNPDIHSITVTNIILVTKKQFRRWNKTKNII